MSGATALNQSFTAIKESAAGTPDRPPAFSQLFEQHIPVITLDFNHTVAHGAPRATLCFELAPKFFELPFIKRNAGNHRYPFPLAAFRCSSHAHDAVTLRNCLFPATQAFRNGLAASGTHPSAFSRVHGSLPHFLLSSMKTRTSPPSYQKMWVIPRVNAYPFEIHHTSREQSFICFIPIKTLFRLKWMSNRLWQTEQAATLPRKRWKQRTVSEDS